MTLFLRKLHNDDFDIYDTFLQNYTETSMFLRSNARRAGLVFEEGKDYSAHYYGAFQDNQLKGVLALNWNGNLFSQVPNPPILLDLLTFAAQTTPQFEVKGVLSPDDQARTILKWLGSPSDNFLLSSKEISYSLDLDKIMVPRLLSDGVWHCRLATHDDLPILSAWRAGYEIEALGQDPDKPDVLKGAREETIKKIDLREIFVLEDQGQLVSQANYNATLPDVYQIGGVWTPSNLRGRGYAKGAVAGALLAAKNQGIKKAILFTKNPSAMKCYESLGFKAVSNYHISLFKTPIMLGK
jgi:uncharacterized protein